MRAARISGRRSVLGAVAATLNETERWELNLYVAGQTPRSLAALENLKKICETYLKGKYKIKVIDLLAHPERARADQIVAIPTLVRKSPPPMKRILGDLSDRDKVLIGLNLIKSDAESSDSSETKWIAM